MTKQELLELKNKILQLKKINETENLLPKTTAYSFLVECSKDRLDSVAINYLGRTITYRELIEKIDNTAKAYAELGIKKGQRVGMSMLMTPEATISFYALNKLGATAKLINITHNTDELASDLESLTSDVFITHDIFYSKNISEVVDKTQVNKVVLSSLVDSLPYGFYGDMIKYNAITKLQGIRNRSAINDGKCINWKDLYKKGEESTINVEPEFISGAPIAIASTSGTTGKSKGVVTTNDAINAVPVQMGMTDETFAPNDSIFTTLPTWIYYSLVNNMHVPLCLGVTLNMDPLFNPKQIHKRLKQYEFNHWNTIPAYVDDMVKDKKLKNMNLSFLKSITTGGDFLTPKLKKEAEVKLKENNSDIYVGQGYGASEILGSFGYTYEPEKSEGTIGKPLVGNRYKILDLDTKEEVGVNQTGEMYLYSPALMKEYDFNEEATNESIVTDKNGVRWYKTGDLAHYDENGELFIDGRIRRIELTKDDKGLPTKIFPDKIKGVILQHPSVEKCEVIMVDDEIRMKKPVCFIVLKDGIEFTKDIVDDINQICLENKLERYSIPVEYKNIEEIPLTPGLKTDYNELQKIYAEPADNQRRKML
ncbi:MAG: acyl--CoA ligase [Firmicutes bacterium]|nr:acyl--CoA ligase [Bacillota bacterium]